MCSYCHTGPSVAPGLGCGPVCVVAPEVLSHTPEEADRCHPGLYPRRGHPSCPPSGGTLLPTRWVSLTPIRVNPDSRTGRGSTRPTRPRLTYPYPRLRRDLPNLDTGDPYLPVGTYCLWGPTACGDQSVTGSSTGTGLRVGSGRVCFGPQSRVRVSCRYRSTWARGDPSHVPGGPHPRPTAQDGATTPVVGSRGDGNWVPRLWGVTSFLPGSPNRPHEVPLPR